MTTANTTSTRTAPAEAPQSLRMAAIDVGSNSIHMIVAQADSDGGITTLWRLKEPVGLGRMSFPSRRLSDEAVDRAISVLGRFKQHALQRQSEKIIAVATSAIREAENGGDFIERARNELGILVKVVSAREEARLIYLAVRHTVQLKDKPHLMIDIGGGSVEFIVGDERGAALLESRKLGAARMTATFVHSDPISKADHAALLQHYAKEIGPLCENIAALEPVKAIGTSGTLENVAAMCEGEGDSDGKADGDGGAVIERERFERLLAKLLESDTNQRAKIRGLDDQRKDQILAGAVLVGEIFTRLKLKRIQMCPAALREGILLDYLARHLPDLAIRREVPDPRRRSVIDLARRCDWHKTHAEQVARITLRLFDELRPLHKMGNAERELIEYGALLHDIGHHIHPNRHHKHSMYLILNGELKNFTPAEVKVIANITRYHRKSMPRTAHPSFAELPKSSRRIVKVGAALLRLADALDRSNSSVTQDVRCRIDGKEVRCAVTARSDAEIELWGAKKKNGLFVDVFDRNISFELAKR